MNNDLLYLIALKNTPLVGDITAKKLINYFGSAENVFAQKKQQLERVGGIGSKIIEQLLCVPNLLLAENELRYAEKNNISIIIRIRSTLPYCGNVWIALSSTTNGDVLTCITNAC